MASPHFEQTLREWTGRKHAVLKKYLRTFCSALSRRTQDGVIYYVDGYAGAGVYKDKDDPTAPVEPGSPVLAAQITQALPYNIECINIEEDKNNFDSLQRETSAFSHVANIHADFNDVVDDVLAIVAHSPAFFFLDPFGTKDLPMDGLIDHIAQRAQPTDILLRYATETVRRLAGAYEKNDVRSPAHARNLDNWFRGTDWRTILSNHGVGPTRDEQLLSYYTTQLETISRGRFKFARAYPIRTIDGFVKYHLVFATGDRLGLKLMSDILYEAEIQFGEQQAAHEQQKQDEALHGQLSMLEQDAPDLAGQQAQQIAAIQKSILNVIQTTQVTWDFDDLRYDLILNRGWFARMSEKEFRTACKSLHAEGKIERLSAGRGWSKGTLFRSISTN